jgi:hypothetical protein
MGLLDDAIREHLELKRRRGADPAEVSREEQEALGPVRRDPQMPAPAGEPLDIEEPLEDEEGVIYDDELSDEDIAYEEEEALEYPPEGPYDAAADFDPEATRLHPGPAESPARGGAAAVPPADDEWGFDDDEEDEEPVAEEPDEDVLDQTPDFLQETPEHDRLWFEQKPPRDFDFDG